MPPDLNLAVQLQIISTIAVDPEFWFNDNLKGSLQGDNLRYLAEAEVVVLEPPTEDGSPVKARFTSDGRKFVDGPFGPEVILKARIREKISQLPDLTDEQQQYFGNAVESLPEGATTHSALRLADLGLARDAEAATAVLEYLKKQ